MSLLGHHRGLSKVKKVEKGRMRKRERETFEIRKKKLFLLFDQKKKETEVIKSHLKN